MQKKLLNLALVLTSFVGYLEWGQGHSAFLLTAEVELLARAVGNPAAVAHPFTVLPLLGQIALLWTLVQAVPGRLITYAGIAGIGLLLVLMCVIGILALNVKILASTIPFLVLAIVTIRAHRPSRS